MASYYSEGYPKERIIYDEVIRKYHPEYKNMCFTQELKVNDQVNSNHLNMEYLLEETISIVGKLGQSNVYGEDYLDNSECKSSSTQQRKSIMCGRTGKRYNYEHLYTIGIKNLNRKKNLIRVVIYNKPKQKVDFFLFTLSEIEFDKEKSKHLNIYYNYKTDTYGRFEAYRKGTFEELCQKI